MIDQLSQYFENYSPSFLYNLELMIKSMLRCVTSNTAEIARAMTKENNQSFKNNDMRVYRFLQNQEFQIDDKLFRCYVNILFDLLKEREIIKSGDTLLVKVDYTSSTNDFLILSASVDFNGRSVPLYFTARKYPKRKGQMDQKKMEQAFIKGLRHILSKKYQYTIVADRGFGNQRFAQMCTDNNFDYILRMNDNLNASYDSRIFNIKTLTGTQFDMTLDVISWKEKHRFVGCTKNDDSWIIMTNIKDKTLKEIQVSYEKRFGIEKCFQDQKSSGFDIEKNKIRKYDRFKRLYFCVIFTQLLVVVIGEFLNSKAHTIKKKLPAFSLLILAYLDLEKRPLNSSTTNVSLS